MPGGRPVPARSALRRSRNVRRRFASPDIVITLIFLCVGVSALIQARVWPFRAGLFPLATAFVLSGAALAKLLVDLVAAWRRPAVAEAHAHVENEAVEAELTDVFETATRAQWLASFGWTGAFFSMLWLLGALITVPLFALVYLLAASRESVWLAGLYAFFCWVFIYGLFDRLLHIPLPTGALLAVFGS